MFFLTTQWLLSNAIQNINIRTILEPSNSSNSVYEEIYDDDKLDFLVLGDWGYQGKGIGTKQGDQKNVAFSIKKWAERNNSQFIINF